MLLKQVIRSAVLIATISVAINATSLTGKSTYNAEYYYNRSRM
jgi:hypothetical protein